MMRRDLLLAVPAILVAAALPYFLGNFTLRTVTDILIYAILASSWNIIGGYTGYASFGNVVFFGVGAYTAGVAMSVFDLGFLPALLLGGLLSGSFGFLVGMPILRLKGHYFAIATLGLAEATKALIQNLGITEGNSGMYLPPPDFGIDASYRFFYYTALAVLVILLLATRALMKSKFGYGLIAIREDEDAAAAIGVNTTLFKSLAFAMNGLFSGLAGAIYAYQQGFIKPEPVFAVTRTVKMIVMAVFGGIGSLLGPTIGAVTIEMIEHLLSEHLLIIHALFFGAVVILAILFLPKGVTDVFSSWRKIGITYFLNNIRKNRV